MCLRRVWEEVLVLGKFNSREGSSLHARQCEHLAGNTSLINFPLTSLNHLFSFSDIASSEETMAISISTYTIIANLTQV